MDFGEFLKARRLSLEIPARSLAKEVEISTSFVTGIERGAQFPSTTMACKFLDALEVEYKKIDPLTVELSDGQQFYFKSTVRGRSKELKKEWTTQELRRQFDTIEKRLSALEQIVLSLIAEKENHA